MSSRSTSAGRLRVIVAGGGVAALETVLALRELAGDRVTVTLLTPLARFSYRPASVLEPFSAGAARHYPLSDVARDLGAELRADGLAAVDAGRHLVRTAAGAELPYDALVLAYGAVAHDRFKHVRTVDDQRLDERLRGLVQDVEDGYLRSLAFLGAAPMAWPLPLYELALMTARAARDRTAELSLTIVTGEPAPLSVFGAAASAAVGELLGRHRIRVVGSSVCEVPEPGYVTIHPGDETLHVDGIVALPALAARQVPGVPDASWLGLIPIDARCRVLGLDSVYAAGDATDFPVKHGGIAAQQADVAAVQIAARAGAAVTPGDLAPVLEGVLLGGDRPLVLRARLDGDRALRSEVSTPAAAPPRISARYLTPYLRRLDELAGTAAG